MDTAYNNDIIAAIKAMVSFRHEMFDRALNLAMNGELSEINEVFEKGETYAFTLDHLDGSSDTNLKLLVELIKKVQETAESLANLNVLNIEEFLKK